LGHVRLGIELVTSRGNNMYGNLRLTHFLGFE
jgi:hypothetical protein